MCEQLPLLAAALGPELASAGPLSEALELTSDEHPEVRAAAFDCGAALLAFCDEERRVTLLEPALRRTVAECLNSLQSPEMAESGGDHAPMVVLSRVAASLSFLFDRLRECGGLVGSLITETRMDGASLYDQLLLALARSPSIDHRCACTEALPAYASGLPHLPTLHACVKALREDDDVEIRQAVAGKLSEVAVALGPAAAAEVVLPLALSILEREPPETLLPLLTSLPTLVRVISPLGGQEGYRAPSPPCLSRLALGTQLLPLLLNLEAPLSSSWRAHHVLLLQYGTLTDYLEPQTLFTLVVPSLFAQLTTKIAAPNRLEAIRILCMQLRRLRTATQRAEVCGRLVRDLGNSDTYALRLNFTHVCGLLLDPSPPCGCSRQFFKAHHLHTSLLQLATDPVANVRLHVCGLLPALKRSLRLPADADALQNLHHAVVALQSDPARDVAHAAAAAEGSLRQLDMLTEGAPLRSSSGAEERRWEAEDGARLREEEALARAEQEALAEAKRRAADELAERARAAYSLKMAAGGGDVGRKSGDHQEHYRRNSRELASSASGPRSSRDTSGSGFSRATGAASSVKPGSTSPAQSARLDPRTSREVSYDAGMGHLGSGGSSSSSSIPASPALSGRRNSRGTVGDMLAPPSNHSGNSSARGRRTTH